MNTIKNLHSICRMTEYSGLDYDESCLWSELDESYGSSLEMSDGVGSGGVLAVVTEFCEGLSGGLL